MVSHIGYVHSAHRREGEGHQKAAFLREQGQRVTHNHIAHFGLRGWTLTMHTNDVWRRRVCMCVCVCVCMCVCVCVVCVCGLTIQSTAQVSVKCSSLSTVLTHQGDQSFTPSRRAMLHHCTLNSLPRGVVGRQLLENLSATTQSHKQDTQLP